MQCELCNCVVNYAISCKVLVAWVFYSAYFHKLNFMLCLFEHDFSLDMKTHLCDACYVCFSVLDVGALRNTLLFFFKQALIDEDRLLSRLEVMGNQLQACSKVSTLLD